MVNMKANVTEETAHTILEKYPQYRFEWLMGLDDDKTVNEKNARIVSTAQAEGDTLWKCMISMSELRGFSIRPNLENQTGKIPLDELLHFVCHSYIISRDGKSATLNVNEFNELENEICDYIEMRLSRIIKNQN